MSQIQSSSENGEARLGHHPQPSPSDPPTRCVNLFLNQFASTRANHVPAYIDEQGRWAVYSLLSRGRKW